MARLTRHEDLRVVLETLRNVLIGSATAVAVLALRGALAWFVLLALSGGVIVAVLLLRFHRLRPAPVAVPDSFARDAFFTDMLNVSRVRVAGVGGLGLLIVAAAIVFQFPLVAVVMAAGAAGGLIGGIALILFRRRHPANAAPGAVTLL
jgi:hypothetical protein